MYIPKLRAQEKKPFDRQNPRQKNIQRIDVDKEGSRKTCTISWLQGFYSTTTAAPYYYYIYKKTDTVERKKEEKEARVSIFDREARENKTRMYIGLTPGHQQIGLGLCEKKILQTGRNEPNFFSSVLRCAPFDHAYNDHHRDHMLDFCIYFFLSVDIYFFSFLFFLVLPELSFFFCPHTKQKKRERKCCCCCCVASL